LIPHAAPQESAGGIAMTVTRPPKPDNAESPKIPQSVIQGIHALRGLLLAAAALITAVTTFIVAVIKN
jgi:hypothetical protein